MPDKLPSEAITATLGGSVLIHSILGLSTMSVLVGAISSLLIYLRSDKKAISEVFVVIAIGGLSAGIFSPTLASYLNNISPHFNNSEWAPAMLIGLFWSKAYDQTTEIFSRLLDKYL